MSIQRERHLFITDGGIIYDGTLTLILRVPIISIHVNKREQHSYSLRWSFSSNIKSLFLI